ncbi:MAG: hypothetical protein KIT84_20655 [Labilithrix sp.]|nr:hypothetical protein [Labilithrix sp.]MCW5813452.1 hypothetical protein [Labilithrix sp.]
MLRLSVAAGLALALVASSVSARAEYMGTAAGIATVVENSVTSIGAAATMNEHDVVVAAPGKGKIVATANADVFCSGDETARTLIIDVEEAQNVMLELCEAHLERRDVMIRFRAD